MIPPREFRLSAWFALMRQSDFLINLADHVGYHHGDVASARALRCEAQGLREVADFLRETE